MRRAHAAAGALTFLHQAVELALGTGVIGQAQIGFPAAVAVSLAADAAWMTAAMKQRPPEAALAFGAGVAIGVPVVHFTLWPWEVQRGVPVLVEAEGLPPRAMAGYNAVLYLWAAAGAVAALCDTPRRHRRWVPAGFLAVVGFRRVAEQHFGWIAAEARRNPRWWNRAWGERSAGDG